MSSPATSSTWNRLAHRFGLSVESFYVASIVAFYFVAALTMVFVNKAVLLSSPTVPLLFLLLQLFMAVILLHVFALAMPRHIQLPRLDLTTMRKLVPVISVSLCGLVFNTLCLRAVEAAYFQIARGLLLPLTIVVSALFTRALPTPTIPVFLAALIVTLGFLMGIAPSSLYADITTGAGDAPKTAATDPKSLTQDSNTIGLFFGILSSLFIAVHSCLIKQSLPHVGGSALALAYWTNLISSILLTPIVLFAGEGTEFMRLVRSASEAMAAGQKPEWQWTTFVWGSIVTGIFGALLGLASMLSVKATSPVTHMFTSAAKSVLQTVLGVWIFHDLVTTGRASSILVILIGTIYYTWVKSQQASAPSKDQELQQREQEMVQRAEEEGLLAVEFDADEDDKQHDHTRGPRRD